MYTSRWVHQSKSCWSWWLRRKHSSRISVYQRARTLHYRRCRYNLSYRENYETGCWQSFAASSFLQEYSQGVFCVLETLAPRSTILEILVCIFLFLNCVWVTYVQWNRGNILLLFYEIITYIPTVFFRCCTYRLLQCGQQIHTVINYCLVVQVLVTKKKLKRG